MLRLETLILILGTILAWVAVELYLVLKQRPTISEEIVRLYRRWPPLGFLVGLVSGLLLGHWFFPA